LCSSRLKFKLSFQQFSFAVAAEAPARTFLSRIKRRHLLACFLLSPLCPRRGKKNMRESLTPILYVIIVIAMTLLYVDYDNIELLKHPLNALHSLSTAHDEADDD
jgi:hypothetical protein